jgi:hypothetical protein
MSRLYEHLRIRERKPTVQPVPDPAVDLRDAVNLLDRWLDLAGHIGTSTTRVREFAALRARTQEFRAKVAE